MILASLGKLSVAQAITDTNPDSANVIQHAAIDFVGMTDVWWVVQTNVAAATAGTIKVELVLSQESTLDNNVQIMCVEIAAITDKRVATAGRYIAAMNVSKQLNQMLEDDGSDHPFIGILYTLSSSVTITVDAFMSFTEPTTLHHRMQVLSNIDNSISVASAGSGA